MPKPKDVKEKLDRMIKAWETLAPDETFAGMTLPQFKAAVQPSYTARDEIAALEAQVNGKLAQRDVSDKVSVQKAQAVVNAVLASETHGPDSALYESFGYVRQSEKKSGLTQRKKTPPKSGTGGAGS